MALFLSFPISSTPWLWWRRVGLLLVLLVAAQSTRAQNVNEAGGTLSPENSTVLRGNNSGTLVLQGYYGTIIRYQADTGNGFVDVGGPGRQYNFINLQTTTRFRAIVQTPTFVAVASTVATVTVVDQVQASEATKPVYENRQASFAPALALKFSPLATQDPSTSTLLVGMEYRVSPRFGIEASYGAQFSALRISTLGLLKDRYDYAYQKFKLEGRRYLLPRSKNPNMETYLSLQAFFVPERYTHYGNNYYRNDNYYSYERNFVSKDIAGLNIKMGAMWHVWSSWLLETGMGFGGRYVVTKYDMLNEHRANDFSAAQVSPFNQIEAPGTKLSIDVELVFKVGYVFPLRHKAGE